MVDGLTAPYTTRASPCPPRSTAPGACRPPRTPPIAPRPAPPRQPRFVLPMSAACAQAGTCRLLPVRAARGEAIVRSGRVVWCTARSYGQPTGCGRQDGGYGQPAPVHGQLPLLSCAPSSPGRAVATTVGAARYGPVCPRRERFHARHDPSQTSHRRRRCGRRRRHAVVAAAQHPGGRGGRPGAGRLAARHRARGPADAGEPLVRPLLRHPARRPRLRRPARAAAPRWPPGLLPAGCRTPRRLPAALPPEHPREQRPGHPLHQPRLARPARGAQRREDGPLAARAPGGRRRQRPVRDGLPHPRGHPLPVRPRRRLHRLRQLLLLGPRPHLAQPPVLDDRHPGPRRHPRRPGHQQHRSGPVPLDHVRRAPAEGRHQLAGLPGAGQLRLQHAGGVPAVP